MGRLKRGTAADAAGWTAEALQQLCGKASSDTWYTHFMRRWYAWEDDKLPGRIARVSLITPLRKKVGSWEARPIAIPMLFHKVAMGVLQRELVQQKDQLCGDRQYGIGRSDGITDMVCDLHIWIRGKQDVTVLQLDMSNAFGTVSRDVTWRRMRILNTAPSRIAADVLSCIHTAVLPTIHGGLSEIPTGGGIPQGDPCSPLLFATTLGCAVEQAIDDLAANGLEHERDYLVTCYLDDMTIACTDANARIIYRAFEIALRQVDLGLNEKKTQIWRPQQEAPADPEFSRLWEALGQPEGLIICGQPVEGPADAGCVAPHDKRPEDELEHKYHVTPMGSQGFMTRWLQQRLEQYQADCQRLQDIYQHCGPDVGMRVVAWQMLTQSFALKHNHLLRTLPTRVTRPWAQQIDDVNRTTLQRILGIESITEQEWLTMCAPLRIGGLGMQSATYTRPTLACAYQLQARTREHMLKLDTRDWEEGELELMHEIQELAGRQVHEILGTQMDVLRVTGMVKTNKPLITTIYRNQMRKSNGTTDADGEQTHTEEEAKLRHMALHHRCKSKPLLSDAAVRHHILKILGRPVFGSCHTCCNFRPPSMQRCGTDLQANPQHPYACARRQVMSRHHATRDWFIAMAREAGWRGEPEQAVRIDSDLIKRADAVLWRPGQESYAIDITFVYQGTNHEHGPLQGAHAKKLREYRAQRNGRTLDGEIIFPIVCGSRGSMHSKVLELLSQLQLDMANRIQLDLAIPWGQAYRDAAIHLQSGLSHLLIETDWAVIRACTRAGDRPQTPQQMEVEHQEAVPPKRDDARAVSGALHAALNEPGMPRGRRRRSKGPATPLSSTGEGGTPP